MGATFTNFQVRVRAGGADALAQQLTAYLGRLGLRPVTGPTAEDEAERSVVIVPPGPGGWATVFDQHADEQDDGAIVELASALSRAGPVLAFAVYDSEDFRWWHFDAGRGRQIRPPGWFRRAGDLPLVAHLLAPGHTLAELRSAFGLPYRHPEDLIQRLAPLFALPMPECQLGYEYREDLEREDFQVLHFARLPAPTEPAVPAASPDLRFEALGVARLLALADDEENCFVHLMFFNQGAALEHGLDVAIAGPALEGEGLFSVTEVRLANEQNDRELTTTPVLAEQDGRRVYRSSFPGFRLPAGKKPPQPPPEMQELARRCREHGLEMAWDWEGFRFKSSAILYIHGTAPQPGQGTMTVTLRLRNQEPPLEIAIPVGLAFFRTEAELARFTQSEMARYADQLLAAGQMGYLGRAQVGCMNMIISFIMRRMMRDDDDERTR